MRMRELLLVVVVVFLCFSCQAKAVLIAGNLDESRGGGQTGLGDFTDVLEELNVTAARLFTTNDQDYYLDSIYFGADAILHNYGTGDLQISLYTNNIDRPGDPVTNGLIFATHSYDQIHLPFIPENEIILESNTTYWIALSADSSYEATTYWWNRNETDAFQSDVIGSSLPGQTAHYWGGQWRDFTNHNYPVAIYGTVVPEPSTLLLIISGAVILRGKNRKFC